MMLRSALAARKENVTTIWAVCLAVILAILIVKMSAIAAVYKPRNVISFYPEPEQETANCAERISECDNE